MGQQTRRTTHVLAIHRVFDDPGYLNGDGLGSLAADHLASERASSLFGCRFDRGRIHALSPDEPALSSPWMVFSRAMLRRTLVNWSGLMA